MISPALSVSDLTVSYGENLALWDVDLQIEAGCLAALVGPNGAGKSTLLKAALELIPRVTGTAVFFGQPLARARQGIAYVPQRSAVDWEFPVTVLDVALMGSYGRLGWLKRPRRTDRDQAVSCLQRVGIADLAHRHISELSGGQQQRVFLARALLQGADLYLMDEPFTGVDAATESTLIETMRSLRSEGKTVIVVHHDLQTVPEYFDEVVLLNREVVAQGPTGSVFTAENLQTTYGGKLALLTP